MRIIRFSTREQPIPRWGWVDASGCVGPLGGSPLEGGPLDRLPINTTLDDVRLLAPTTPTKIIGVGRNYAAHAAEHAVELPAQPLLFLKPPSAVIGPGEAIRLPPQSSQVEHEVELAVVIGRPGRRIPEARAAGHVLGYTVGLDITARDLQRADPQWTRGKGFDTFCPLGPWIETELALGSAELRCAVNGAPRQQGSPAQMIFSVEHLIAYASTVMTLQPGDVILTGTPSGVGPLQHGDQITASVAGIGEIAHDVLAEEGDGIYDQS